MKTNAKNRTLNKSRKPGENYLINAGRIDIVLLIILLAIPILAGRSDAQPASVKWGKIDPAEFQAAASDSEDAAAVILVDYGNCYFDEHLDLVYERYRRVKVLKESGFDWGTVKIPYRARDREQRVKKIEGNTFVLLDNGKIKKYKLKKKAIFKEKIDHEWKRYRFTMPNLQPGTIFEYRYKIISEDPYYFPDWTFQYAVPVKLSEFEATIPDIYYYATIIQNKHPFNEMKNDPCEIFCVLLTKSRYGGLLGGMISGQSTVKLDAHHFLWKMRDVPPIEREPFYPTVEDSRSKIFFQLAEIRIPGRKPYKIFDTWSSLSSDIKDHDLIGKQLEKHKIIRNKALELTAELTDDRSKMVAIYDYVRQSFAWDERYRFLPDRDLKKVFQSNKGSSSEINLLLTALLKGAGLEAEIIVTRTRDKGKINKRYPLTGQLNHLLAGVVIGDKQYVLDATDPLRTYDLLPVSVLNGQGLIVRNRPKWIRLEAEKTYAENININGRILENGDLECRFSIFH